MELSVKINIANQHKIEIDSFMLKNRKINFLFGESGIGKTIISKAVLGLLPENEFEIEIDGVSYNSYLQLPGAKEIIKKSFFVFQEPSTHLSTTQTVLEQLSEGDLEYNKEDRESLSLLFRDKKRTEIDQILKTFPKSHRPSGGEKQRILNMMAFLKMKELSISTSWNSYFFFDEPTGFLDIKTRNLLLENLVKNFVIDKPTFLIITHDYSIITYLKQSFPDYFELFSFREIKKIENSLIQRDFDEFDYLFWLEKQKNHKVRKRRKREILLKLNSRVKIFGKTLKFYKDKNFKNEVNLELNKGEIIYLKAGSGVGKTTIAKVIMGLAKAEFNLEIDGIMLNQNTKADVYINEIWGKKISMVFQNADEALNPNSTIEKTFLQLPVNINQEFLKTKFAKLFPNYDFERIWEKKINQLSGGEKQKINLLRVLLLKTEIIILDEPVTGADLDGIKIILNYLKELVSEKKAILLISHSEDIFDTIVSPSNIIYLKD